MNSKVALLIVDLQNCFLEQVKATPDFQNACEHINHVSELLRKGGHVVVHIRDVEGADDKSQEQLALIGEIERHEDDLCLDKIPSNAFCKTELADLLNQRNVGLVVVSGFAAEYCVLFTYNGAIENGFKAAMLQNGILSNDPAEVYSCYKLRHTISYPVLEFLLES